MLAKPTAPDSRIINHPLPYSQLAAIAQLLQSFEETINCLLSYDSFEYICDALGQHVVVGWPHEHQASYALNLSNLNLGELILTRSSPFRESELHLLEDALPDLLRQIADACGSPIASR